MCRAEAVVSVIYDDVRGKHRLYYCHPDCHACEMDSRECWWDTCEVVDGTPCGLCGRSISEEES